MHMGLVQMKSYVNEADPGGKVWPVLQHLVIFQCAETASNGIGIDLALRFVVGLLSMSGVLVRVPGPGDAPAGSRRRPRHGLPRRGVGA